MYGKYENGGGWNGGKEERGSGVETVEEWNKQRVIKEEIKKRLKQT